MKKLLSKILCTTMLLSGTNALAYNDIEEAHWAWQYVDTLSQMNIINGYENGSFCPDGYVTRGEFAKMLVLSMESDGKTEISYPDIQTHWAKEYIEKSANITYTPSDKYLPDSNASRGEIGYALAMALNLEASQKTPDYSDWGVVDDNIRSKLSAASEHGIIKGYDDGTIRASDNVTRAEACALIVRAMDYKKETTSENSDNTLESSDTTDIVTDDGLLSENAEKPIQESQTDKHDSIFPEGTQHIYTLYPQKNLILVCGISRSTDDAGNEAYKIRYKLSGDEEEYTSVIPDDGEIKVIGTKSALSDIRKGDVIIMNTPILTHIDSLLVLSSLKSTDTASGIDSVIPNSSKLGAYGSNKDYEFASGVVSSFEKSNKTYDMILTASNKTTELSVPKNATTIVYEPRGRVIWSADTASVIEENDFVYVRCTDGDVTEVIVYK